MSQSLIDKRQLAANVSDLVSGYGASLFYPISNPSGFATGLNFNTGIFATTGQLAAYYLASNPSGFITGNLSNYATTDNLNLLSGNLVALSGQINGLVTSNQLSATLTQYASTSYVSQINNSINTVSGNLISTGQTISNLISSTGTYLLGQFNNFTGSLNLGTVFATTGNLANTGIILNSSITSLSGSLVASGAFLSGQINSLSGAISSTYATTGNLYLTGLKLTTGIANTGAYLLKLIYSGITGGAGGGLSGQLVATGSNLSAQIQTLSGNLTTTGYNLATNLASTGSYLYTNLTGLFSAFSGTLTGNYATAANVALTGQTILSNISTFSGMLANYQLTGTLVNAPSVVISSPNISSNYNSPILSITGQASGSVFSQIQNTYTGATASTDFTLYNDLNTAYLDIGICSSKYNGTQYSPQFTVVGASDSYMYATGGSLSIGTVGTGQLYFFTSGSLNSNIAMVVTNGNNVNIQNNLTVSGSGNFPNGLTLSGSDILSYLPNSANLATTGQTLTNLITSLSGTLTGGYQPLGAARTFAVNLYNNSSTAVTGNNYIGGGLAPYTTNSGSNYAQVPFNCTGISYSWSLYLPTGYSSTHNWGFTIQTGNGPTGTNLGIFGTVSSGVNTITGTLPTPLPLLNGATVNANWRIISNAPGNATTNSVTLYCAY
jgi:hypothetical protein